MNLKAFKPIRFIIMVLLLVSLACVCSNVIPTQEPDAPPAETEPPQAPEQPQEEPQETEPPSASAAQEFFKDEFDGDISNWSQFVGSNGKEGNTNEANIQVEDGRLVFDFGKWLIGYIFYEPFEYTNVRIDVRFENRGTNVNNILLFCRFSDEGHYLVNIANSGLYKINAFDGSKGSYAKIADGGSTKIRPGKEFNEFGLVCNERDLVLYINGVETRRYTDNQFVFRKGLVGFGVASEDQVPVKIEFDWVEISQP